MSSTAGEAHEGGNNDDVEADESTRNAEARLQDDAEGIEDQDEQDFPLLATKDDVEAAEEDVTLPEESTEPGATAEDAGEVADDYFQFRGDDLDAEDLPLDDGPVTPTNLSPLASPAGSGSIPDDTPSLRGSVASSPGPVTPMSRKIVSRTASGALQPFERRFEARLSASSSPSPRAGSPAFLSPPSRQISLSSQPSQFSSRDGDTGTEILEAPWDVIRWTKLRKITGQAFSEAGKRNFGRPTCMAVSALIAIGTSKGLVIGFDYHQTLKVIIGQGTKATECGSVTSLTISADYSTIASGHANGHIFTWEINRPARPFLTIVPLDRGVLEKSRHPDGHLANCAVLHLGFLGTRHTAIVSADAGGMAFSHLATRGLGPVTRTVKSTRLLGRYPPAESQVQPIRKPSSVLAFSPLPLGNVEQATDSMGLTALLTPYLLVIVSTTPIAQTQHKSPRPKEISPHSTLSGCLAWFPAVKLKNASADAEKGNSETKLVYCWSNVLTVLDVHVVANATSADPQKPPSLEFHARSQWRADEAIVAIQWLGRSVLAALTISQRLLIVEDGSLRVTDSIDLLHRHIYHQDPFSYQLSAVVEQLNSADPSLHGVVADAFYMSFRAYKGRTFLLGFNDLTVGTLSNWADRLMALMEAGDHIAAIRLATEYYNGGANSITIGLPEVDDVRHEMVKERLLAMISASLGYTFSQHDDARESRLREVAEVCFNACVTMGETDYLFANVFDLFQDAEEESVFISMLEPYVLDDDLRMLPPEVIQAMVSHFISENQAARLEELLIRLDPASFDIDQISMLCRQHMLYDALIYIWTQALRDWVTPLIDLLTLIKMLQAGGEDEMSADNPFHESACKVYPYLAYSLTGRRYPNGMLIEDHESTRAKADLYEYVFAGTPTTWPSGSQKVFHTSDEVQAEPAFPYLKLLLQFDAASFMSMLNEAFEDTFLNEANEDAGSGGSLLTNGANSRPAFKMSRQHITQIMLDVMRQGDFEPDQTIYLDMFMARSLPKYPGQLILSGTLWNAVLQRLCNPPSDTLREDCQLSVEYLLSAYRPTNMAALIEALHEARFYRVLKTVYRGERMLVELLETYFQDEEDKEGVFDSIAFCLRSFTGLSPKQVQSVKQTISRHIPELANIDDVLTSRTLALSAPDLLQPSIGLLRDSHQQFVFLRVLLEPSLLRNRGFTSSPLPAEKQSDFTEQYVQLMCENEPSHVADYIDLLSTSDLRLDHVLPAMENFGVIDAAVVLLARDGMARDAMDRLVTHMQSLRHALTSMVDAAAASQEVTVSQDAADGLIEDIEKYTKVGIWLCRGQSATAQRRLRPRTNLVWDIKEDDLDLDEYLWLNLVDVVVQVSQHVMFAVNALEDHVGVSGQGSLDGGKVLTSLRSNAQQTFTALLASTSVPAAKREAVSNEQPIPRADHMSFLRVLRTFLTRAAQTAPSLAELRVVLSDIFSAYTFEQGVLSLANELLGSDVFTDMEEGNKLRQRGWRPRTQVCEHCKRRAWGTGIGEIVWDQWIAKEQEREAEKARKIVERGGGAEARRLSRGKAKALTSGQAEGDAADGEEIRRLTLVVFACRHVFHRVCLDEEYRSGRPPRIGMYTCPLCKEQK